MSYYKNIGSSSHVHVGELNEHRHCLNLLPRFEMDFPFYPNSSNTKLPSLGSHHEDIMHVIGSCNSSQKRLFVFDKSGDQTTLFVSSLAGNHVPPPVSWTQKPNSSYGLGSEDPGKKMTFHRQEAIITKDLDGSDAESELHEDTEELNALLYSDDNSEDDEASTGHWPSAIDKPERFNRIIEDVASCDELKRAKRRRLNFGGYEISLTDTASSAKHNELLKPENDDEEETCLLPEDNKRARREDIRSTVNILRNLIPGVKEKDKDVVGVLDESIEYLKSLKLKAKALGLH